MNTQPGSRYVYWNWYLNRFSACVVAGSAASAESILREAFGVTNLAGDVMLIGGTRFRDHVEFGLMNPETGEYPGQGKYPEKPLDVFPIPGMIRA